jgi:hypothetical protein
MDMLDHVEFLVAKLELGPTDVLAVRTTRPLTSVMAAELCVRLERRLNLAGRLLVLDPGTELTVVVGSDVTNVGREIKTDTRADVKTDARRGGKG